MKRHPDFDFLVENAFDFLREAIAEFKDKPKYSIIHFCAAVELILKARLLREHWMLVLKQPEKANLSKFKKGDFLSVSVKDAIQRLNNVLGKRMSEGEAHCFTQLAEHRNRMIHFYHSGNRKEIEKIATEECRAWFYLHRLMTEGWRKCFANHAKTINTIGAMMRMHKNFLAATFAARKVEIARLKKEGHTLLVCPSCGYQSMKSVDRTGDLSQLSCLVCDFQMPSLVIECPSCKDKVHFRLDYLDAGFTLCPGCGKKFTPETLCDLLDEGRSDDPYEPNQFARCGECDEQTVICYGGQWLCTSCLTVYADVATCEYCNTPHAGLKMDDSFFSGCPDCGGRASDLAARDD